MFTKGLSKQTQSNLESLSNVQFVSKYYLAGGTGLSLHLGHRFSQDIDFFSLTPEKSIIIASGLMNKGMLEVLQNDEGTFRVKLSFFLYPYKLLFPVVIYRNVKIADILDIACMKIEAISSRGTKRDFVDLYTICNTTKSLQELLTLFEEKYEGIKYNMLHILKSLVYFEDAEHDEMPRMITNISWNEVKEFFQIEAKKFIFPVG